MPIVSYIFLAIAVIFLAVAVVGVRQRERGIIISALSFTTASIVIAVLHSH